MNRRSAFPDQDLLDAALLKSGQAFFSSICSALLDMSGAHLALIGSLKIAEAEQIEILALSSSVEGVDVQRYDAFPAPCLEVLTQKQVCVHLNDLDRRFPDDVGIQSLQSKSYVGFPLLNMRGSPVGILVLEWAVAIPQELADDVIAQVSAIIPRLQTEVAQHNVAHAFEALIAPKLDTPEQSEEEIFRSIVQQAAALSQVHSTVLTRCLDGNEDRFQVLAACAGGQVLPEAEGRFMTYHSAPCGELKTQDTHFQGRGLRETYPEVSLFQELGVEAYCGFGFRDSDGRPIGHLAFLHDRPMAPRMLECRIVNIIASRAGQELQRHFAEAERNALREALSVRKKLESLGLMAGTIAHDFNNQLSAIIGHTELAMLELAGNHPASATLGTAEQCMWRARDVIGDLMDFAGDTPKSPASVIHLTDVAEQALPALQADLPDGVRIETAFANQLPAMLGRSMQLHRMLGNLALNGIEAMRETGGALTIKVTQGPMARDERSRCLTGHGARLPDVCLCLEIADTGRGMDAQAAERVFDPFFSTKGVGRGLGLSGVLGIAKRFPASLTFDTELGKGTRFRLYFAPSDAAEPGAGLGQGRTEAAGFGTNGKVLVVDDEPDVLKTIVMLVKSLGFEVCHASSGKEALELARTAPDFDLAMVDVVMPDMDGWETLSALRRVNPNLSAIAMTGYMHSDANRRHGERAGVTIMTKPFSRMSLQSSLTHALQL